MILRGERGEGGGEERSRVEILAYQLPVDKTGHQDFFLLRAR